MTVAEHLHRLGGFASREALVRLTSRRRVDKAVAAGEVLQISRGRCALPTADKAILRAQQVRGVVSHLSAAAWWGWGLKRQPDVPQVTVPKHRRIEGSRVGVHFVDLRPEEVHTGLVTHRERTLVDCLRLLPFDEALAVADSALRHGHITSSGVTALAASVKGPGAPQVRRVAAEARGEAANPSSPFSGHSRSRPASRFSRRDASSTANESVVPDLVDRQRLLVLEADSFEWHTSRAAMRRDCQRYNWLVRHGWAVLRFAYEDVMFEQEGVLDLLGSMRRASRWTEVRHQVQKPA